MLALALTALPACDFSFIDAEDASVAEFFIRGTSQSGTVRVITSTTFEAASTDDGQPYLLEADTAVVEMPFQSSRDISANRRFYVQASNPDSSAATLTLRVLIGGDERYNVSRTVTTETLDFRFVSLNVTP